jgi:hypothetical protein
MNCFVIMPFAAEFDDVYQAIKGGVEDAVSETGGKCFRLDESRPAGRITDRLLTELRTAAFCTTSSPLPGAWFAPLVRSLPAKAFELFHRGVSLEQQSHRSPFRSAVRYA